MKFYYKDRLVRTSNHDYKFAIIDPDGGKAIKCTAKGRETLEAELAKEIDARERSLKWFEQNSPKYVDSVRKGLQEAKRWIVVELEAREK